MRQLNKAVKMLCEAAGREADKQLGLELSETVQIHSGAAAAAGLASGWIPGAGALAASGIAAASIWSMYARINNALGLSLSENILKSLAAGVAANLASYFVGGLVIGTVFSLVPGLGSVASSVVVGGTIYALTVASGIVYMKVLTELFEAGVDPTKLDEEQLKARSMKAAEGLDFDAIKKEATSSYKKSKK